MRKVKKALRFIGVVLLIILASLGIGLTGVFLPTNRERYMDAEVKIEQVDKEEEDEGEMKDVKD